MIRRIVTTAVGFAIACTAPAHAQEATGYWTGSIALNEQTNIRVGVAIEQGAQGLSGSIDSPDQNAYAIPLANVTAEGDTLSFSIPAIAASFAGRWNDSTHGWSGMFSQPGQQWPLVLAPASLDERYRPAPIPDQWSMPDEDRVLEILQKRVAGRPGAGAAVGIIAPGATRVLAAGPAGTDGFDGNTIFEIGSMTKVFTALVLADMALKGEVSLDDPVQQYLPEGAAMPASGGERITLRQLSMQNSGLPRLPDNMPFLDPLDPYADYTEALLLDFLAGYQLPREPGAEYEYSNLGVGLLGYALARAAGTDYASLVRERILAPLAMDDTAITLSPDQQSRFATPHDEFLRVGKPWHIPVIGGAGALRSSANDMLKFLGSALDPQSPIGPAMELTLSDRLDQTGTTTQTALGWMIPHFPTGEVLMHGGGTGGFRTMMALQPASGRAVVALTNSSVNPAMDDIAMHLVAGAPLVNEIPVPPAPATIEHVEVDLAPGQLERMTGTYRITPGAIMEITRDGGQLSARLTGQPAFPIFPSAPLEFFWRVVDARIVFSEEDGAIVGATMFQNGQEIPMEKLE